MLISFPKLDFILQLLLADHGVENTILQCHPFPEGTAGDILGGPDFVLNLTRLRVDELAGLIVPHKQNVGSGDEHVSMDHHPFGQLVFPKQRSVIRVVSHHAVEVRFFAFMPGDVAISLEHPSARRDRHLRSGTIARIGQELGQVGRHDLCVVGERVVVRAVVRVRPVVRPSRDWLDDRLVAEDHLAAWTQHAQQFRFRSRRIRTGDNHRVDKIAGEVQFLQIALGDVQTPGANIRLFRSLTPGSYLLRIRGLNVHE